MLKHIRGRMVQSWANLIKSYRMTPISLLDIVAKGLKWLTLRRLSRLASNKMGAAGAAKELRDTP